MSNRPVQVKPNLRSLPAPLTRDSTRPWAEMDQCERPLDRLWSRGGFPESFLAEDEPASLEWREAFVRT